MEKEAEICYRVDSQDVWVEGEYIWMFSNKYRSICKIDILTRECEIICNLQNESRVNRDIDISMLLKIDQKIVLIPNHSYQIIVYDMNVSKILVFTLKKQPCNEIVFDNQKTKFIDAIVLNEAVYIIPNWYTSIVKIDLLAEEMTYITDIIHAIYDMNPDNKKNQFFSKGWFFKGDNIVLSLRNINAILVSNKDFDDYSIIKIETFLNRIDNMVADEKNIWFAGMCEDKAICTCCNFDLREKEKVEIPYLLRDNGLYAGLPALRLLMYENELVLYSHNSTDIYFVDKISKKTSCFSLDNRNESNYSLSDVYIGGIGVYKDSILFVTTNNWKWYLLNTSSLKVNSIDLLFSDEFVEEGLQNLIKKGNFGKVFMEGDFPLSTYINCI